MRVRDEEGKNKSANVCMARLRNGAQQNDKRLCVRSYERVLK